MNKIPTIFLRDWDNNPKYVTREKNPECQWVFDGEGDATRKWDGVCVAYLLLHGAGGPAWYARREVKKGKPRPAEFWPLATDEETGKTMGWEPIEQSAFYKYFKEALGDPPSVRKFGTYELIGPRINGNPDNWFAHALIPHGWAPLMTRVDLESAPRDYDGLAIWLHERVYEGIVFHHPDGRKAKIKKRDFPEAGR